MDEKQVLELGQGEIVYQKSVVSGLGYDFLIIENAWGKRAAVAVTAQDMHTMVSVLQRRAEALEKEETNDG